MFQIIKITTIIFGFAILPGCRRDFSLLAPITGSGAENKYQDISTVKMDKEPTPLAGVIGKRNDMINVTMDLNELDGAGPALANEWVNKSVRYCYAAYPGFPINQVFLKSDTVSGMIKKYAGLHSKGTKPGRVIKGFLKIDITN